MSNKKIDINLDLFNIGSKTRRKREKKQKPTNVPLISPNVLKNKLLKRIKEHKLKETENLENNKRKLPSMINGGIIKNENNKSDAVYLGEYTDEFNDSINYLQTLSKQKKENEIKKENELNKLKMKNELDRRTVKNYQALSSSSNLQHVNIELPEELKEPLLPMNLSQFVFDTPNVPISNVPISNVPISNVPISNVPISYTIDTVPYGCLKNGIKPTYKDWNKTQKNNIVSNPNLSVVIDSQISERENRLNALKNKIKEKREITNPIEQIVSLSINSELGNINECEQEILSNKMIKRTISRKYTLGKTANNMSVGVLIKDRNTRKKILIAQRELKKKSINDIKSYLKDHNLIKVGSNAPNDVLRKLYESSMLAGEITNSNSDTLLHNLLKDEKEL